MDRQQEFEGIRKECLDYFQQSPVWIKVLNGFREKYSSYGRFGGKVVLKNLKLQDIEELEGFFGKSFHGQKSVTVSAEKFRQALEASRYREITPEYLLENFFGEPLLGKQEQKLLREQEKDDIWNDFCRTYEGTPIAAACEWLKNIVKDSENQKLAEWNQRLCFGAEIYNHLPYRQNQKLYLAVFAAMLTGNPHAFDNGTPDGNFLYQMIQMDLAIRDITIETSEIFPAYKRQKSYLMTGIMLDDISNYAMLYQVQATKKDGTFHKGIMGFGEEQHIVQIPLAVIMELERLQCPQDVIYIVENPSVFAVLCGKEEGNIRKAYMCMNGQPRLSGLMVLDLLAKSGTKIYYAGDLDPEGLLIAQKLSQYYKGEFHYWHMETSDYEKCRSEEVISSKRMKILERITDERLKPVAEMIEKCGTAGYQEMLMIPEW